MTDLANWLKSEGEPASRSDRRLANRFLCYWEQLRGRQPFPLITDISFDDIREFSPHIFNIELSAGFGDPVIRFVGKDIEALCGGDLANRTLRELPPQSLLAAS